MENDIQKLKRGVTVGHIIMISSVIVLAYLDRNHWVPVLVLLTIPFSIIIGIYLLSQIKKLVKINSNDSFIKTNKIFAIIYLTCIPNLLIATLISGLLK